MYIIYLLSTSISCMSPCAPSISLNKPTRSLKPTSVERRASNMPISLSHFVMITSSLKQKLVWVKQLERITSLYWGPVRVKFWHATQCWVCDKEANKMTMNDMTRVTIPTVIWGPSEIVTRKDFKFILGTCITALTGPLYYAFAGDIKVPEWDTTGLTTTCYVWPLAWNESPGMAKEMIFVLNTLPCTDNISFVVIFVNKFLGQVKNHLETFLLKIMFENS